MANKNLFATFRGMLEPKTDAVNEAGGRAYAMTPKQALAQYAATGCLSATFYASATEQLESVLRLAAQVESEFLAKLAIEARERGRMKDMPALLLAILTTRNLPLAEAIFPRVIDNGKMLRNFVQVLRSGAVGRKSLGTAPKRMVRRWLEARSDDALFRDSVGNSPSLTDVLKMVHPKPATKEREALYGYLIGRPHDAERLPKLVRHYEAFKRGETKEVPAVPFELLTGLELEEEAWRGIARHAGWQMTRMNLNTFARHGVFAHEEMTTMIAKRLADREAVQKARVFPYQLMVAYKNAAAAIPLEVRNALQAALEIATENVPAIEGKVYVCPDVSGSMHSALTGSNGSTPSTVRCIDVAALVTAAIVRKNRDAEILPFDTKVVDVFIDPNDEVLWNAEVLAAINGGGTTVSAPLAKLNKRKAIGDLVILVSDNESWADPQSGRGTELMREWNAFVQRNPNARLVCIDIQPNATTQAQERTDVLNVGGFSDAVFPLIADFATGRLTAGHWVETIERISLADEAVA